MDTDMKRMKRPKSVTESEGYVVNGAEFEGKYVQVSFRIGVGNGFHVGNQKISHVVKQTWFFLAD